MKRTLKPHLLLATIIIATSLSCKSTKKPCQTPDEDTKLINALKEASFGKRKAKREKRWRDAQQDGDTKNDDKFKQPKPNLRFIRRIMERLSANSQNRARDVCRAIDSPSDNSSDLYNARILALLDREQQLTELNTVTDRLSGLADELNAGSKSVCTSLWTATAHENTPATQGLLDDCDKDLDKLKRELIKKLDTAIDKSDEKGSFGSLLRNAESVLRAGKRTLVNANDLTIGDIATKCEKERPGCAAAFSLARFVRQTDDKRLRFDYERAIVYSMVVGARRAEQAFDSVLLSADWSASLVDLLARPLFHAVVASVETYILEKIEGALSEQKGYLIRGGLLQAACNAYNEFDLAAPPNAAERTVRSIILSFHQPRPKKDIEAANDSKPKPKPDTRPICTPEASLMDQIPQAREKTFHNLKRAGTPRVARNLRKELKGTDKEHWHIRAASGEPVDVRTEIGHSRDLRSGELTDKATERANKVSTCIWDQSPYCSRSGSLNDYSSCIADLCGTKYYQYFVNPEATSPLKKDEDCCDNNCCGEDQATAVQVFESSLRLDLGRRIKEKEEEILTLRCHLLKALDEDISLINIKPDREALRAMCSKPRPPDLSVTINFLTSAPNSKDSQSKDSQSKDSLSKDSLTSSMILDFNNPMPLLWASKTQMLSCMLVPDKDSASAEQERVDSELAKKISERLRSKNIAHRTVFTGYSSVLNASTCRQKGKLGWDQKTIDAFNQSGFLSHALVPPRVDEKDEWPNCPGGTVNQILRFLRAYKACTSVLGGKCVPGDDVVVQESLEHEWSADRLCSTLKDPPTADRAWCEEQRVSRCLATINSVEGKDAFRGHAKGDRKVTVAFATTEELENMQQLRALRAELDAVGAAFGSCQQ